MKKKFKILTILLVTSVFISSISFGAFGEDSGSDIAYLPELQNGTETELEESADTSSVDEERDFSDETETAYFEFTEADLSSSSRVIGGGEVDFGPPEDDSTTLVVTSAIIPDGVYAIESVFAPGLWIDVNGSTISGTQVWQDYHSTPTNSFNRIALFKIKYVATTQSYVIRLMTNNMLTLGFDELGNVITKTISSPYDGQVQPSETFTITRMTNGYMIRQYGETNDALASKTDGGGELYITDSFLKKRPASEAGDKAIWKFYKYTGVDKHGMLVSYSASYTNIGIPVGTTGTMHSKTWSTVIGANLPYMQAESNSTAMISTSFDDDSCVMSFTALSPGYATIKSMIREDDSSTSEYTERKYFQVIPEEGTYYIQNASTERYIDIDDSSSESGTNIQQWQYYAGNQLKWNIEHVANSGGYVRIKSVYNGLYMGINSSNPSSIKLYGIQNDYTLWKIERSTRGNLMLICKATASLNNVLAVPLSSNDNGINLTQVTYTNDSNVSDEWYLVKKVISYVNYYDSTFVDNAQLIQNIEIANSFSNLVFSRHYNIGMHMDGVASQYATVIDSCSTGTNNSCMNSTCGSDCCTEHHKNCWVVSNQLYNSEREDDHIYIMWTNRRYATYCDASSGKHLPVSWIAVVCGKRPVIHFMTINGDETIKLACMALNLAHETSHTLGMDDVYNNPGHDVRDETMCLMEKFDPSSAYDFYQNVLAGYAKPFCDSCDEALKNYTSNIVISGN